jgi:transcription-repair coupling factor (superfamily II helicase)
MNTPDFRFSSSPHQQSLPPLAGSSDALVLAGLAAQRRPLVIITESAWQAQRLRAELTWFAPTKSIHLLPDWETLPYDQISPHQDLISERLSTLYQFSRNACDIALVPITTALYRLPPEAFLVAHTFFLRQGERLDLPALRSQLTVAGYANVSQVLRPGEYAMRGGLIDLFPMGSAVPYRIDLMDSDIETIRTFDVDTQRSIYPVKEIRLLPAREFPFDEAGRSAFRQNFREKFEGDPSKSALYKDVSNGIAPAGIEYYLPLFFESTATLFDYLPADATVCMHHDVANAIDQFWRDVKSRHELLGGDRTRPIMKPADLFLRAEDFFVGLKPFARIDLPALSAAATHVFDDDKQLETSILPALDVDRRANNPIEKLATFVNGFSGRVLLVAESLGRRETLLELFGRHELKPATCDDYAAFVASDERIMLSVAPLASGFILTRPHWAVITENELYATQVKQTRRRDARKATSEGMLRDLSEVRVGDPVVHAQHGIGRYLGLVNLDLGEGETEFLHLEYGGSDKLYIPVAQLHQISRYSGASPDAAPLHRLGSGQWEKAKRKAAEQVRDTAAELLNLYAQRAAREGFAFGFQPADYDNFVAGFQFEETPDQASAISAVIEDMKSGKPMDRLVCGDVGFGKTEVAMRAAFVAVSGGKQVAILVPTTLLAEQHFENFSDRFAEWPVKIAEISRFRSAKELTAALAGLADGTIDIVIGTHRLIQKDVKFKRLGLTIIDEEHRFGVRQKEQLKSMRAEVDVLTLTATPIPRTLAMSMEGLRDFSVIATAPQKRLSIKTFVYPYNIGIIREAVLRELKRGGQVYFLHNDVDTIQLAYEKLAGLLPEARIAVAHGQLRERDLEHVMRDFYQQHFNVLLCSTIIETGIDVPTANTIIIERADKFGLAQLHQLRGRVGRSHHQAYAYLLTPPEDSLTAQAKKRLEAIQMMEDLGSGFFLAMHDLEIRGAGEILGDSQSGEMQEIGFNLYVEMLDSAVRALKQGKVWDVSAPLDFTTEINLHVPALLPNDYCGDVHERLVLYKRLASCQILDELSELQEEMIDRFGLPTTPVKALIESHRLRVLAKHVGVAKIDASLDAIQLQFIPNPPIDAARVIQLIQKNRHYKLAGPDKLKVIEAIPDLEKRVSRVRALLSEFQ